MRQQPVSIGAEARVMPHRIVEGEPYKPALQQVVTNLFDQVIATAILDSLLHHATTLTIKVESYRLKDKHKAGLILGISHPQEDPDDTEAQKANTANWTM